MGLHAGGDNHHFGKWCCQFRIERSRVCFSSCISSYIWSQYWSWSCSFIRAWKWNSSRSSWSRSREWEWRCHCQERERDVMVVSVAAWTQHSNRQVYRHLTFVKKIYKKH